MTTRNNRNGGKGVESVFNNIDSAEWAVQYLLDHTDLSQLAPGTSVTISIDTHVKIGWGYQRVINKDGTIGTPIKVTGITSVTAWIYVDSSGVPHVMDAFPTLANLNK